MLDKTNPHMEGEAPPELTSSSIVLKKISDFKAEARAEPRPPFSLKRYSKPLDSNLPSSLAKQAVKNV
jgi:hypothetical protein